MREPPTSLAVCRWRQYHQAEISEEAACITRQSTPTPKGVRSLRSHLFLGAGYFHVSHHGGIRLVLPCLWTRERPVAYELRAVRVPRESERIGYHGCTRSAPRSSRRAAACWRRSHRPVLTVGTPSLDARGSGISAGVPVLDRRETAMMANKAVNTDAQGRPLAALAPVLGRGLLLR
jgi:hypothetical protein